MTNHLLFSLRRSEIRDRVLIPKYYDPELLASAEAAREDYELPTLRELLLPNAEGSRLGTWIPREHYGTGDVPYVRTSDFNNWRLRPDHKKSVPLDIYEKVAKRQDVRPGDILMVAHGTYLVGSVAIVTDSDTPMVLQDHVFRLRVSDTPELRDPTFVDRFLVLAALSTAFVKRQVRSRQFSADIIDKIGERHLEIKVPIPRDVAKRQSISSSVRSIIEGQTQTRTKVYTALRSDMRMSRERSDAKLGFSVQRSAIRARVLIPKYYDPSIQDQMRAEVKRFVKLVSIGDLVDRGLLSCGTGIEVGKMAYGTGAIPFIRTTDIAEMELKTSPRQGVSESIYSENQVKAAIQDGDILLVRDGTYLVGSSAMVQGDDLPALICGGIYRLRSLDFTALPPATLLAMLNLSIVRRQMRAKQFTRDVIDTLGKRLFEVMVPDPSSAETQRLGSILAACMLEKSGYRRRLTDAVSQLEPQAPAALKNRPGWSMR